MSALGHPSSPQLPCMLLHHVLRQRHSWLRPREGQCRGHGTNIKRQQAVQRYTRHNDTSLTHANDRGLLLVCSDLIFQQTTAHRYLRQGAHYWKEARDQDAAKQLTDNATMGGWRHRYGCNKANECGAACSVQSLHTLRTNQCSMSIKCLASVRKHKAPCGHLRCWPVGT